MLVFGLILAAWLVAATLTVALVHGCDDRPRQTVHATTHEALDEALSDPDMTEAPPATRR